MLRKIRVEVAAAIFFSVAISTTAMAQGFGGPQYAIVSSSVSPATVAPGSGGKLIIRIAVKPGFHIQAAKPTDPDVIPTSFAPSTTPSFHFLAPKFPKDVMMTMAGETKPSPVYTGTVTVSIPFTVDKTAHKGTAKIGGTLTYQGCNATSCYPPKTSTILSSIAVK